MSTKHTPGPWAWRGKSGSLHAVGVPPHTYGRTVLSPTHDYDSGVDTEVSEADAALIAAAPDLLESCKRLLEELRLIRMKDSGAVYDVTCRIDAERAIQAAEVGE